jgi:hypothetical protein
MVVTSRCDSIQFQSQKIVQDYLNHIKNFTYIDDQEKCYVDGTSFAPIATLKMQKQGWSLERAKHGVDLMQKTFALLLSYSPLEEQIDLTFTPTADSCFHAFLEINPLWVQFKKHIGREIYHYPFVYGEDLKCLRDHTATLFVRHFNHNPFDYEEATSCSSCCLSPNPPMPIPEGW